MSERIVRDGWVVAAEGEWLEVQVGRPDACGHCAAAGACNAFSGGSPHRARARNLCHAAVGQRVRLEMDAAPLLKAAFGVYFLPAVGMVVAAVAGQALSGRVHLSPDAGAALGALAALGVSALALFVHGRRHSRRDPVFAAVEVLEDAAPCPASAPQDP